MKASSQSNLNRAEKQALVSLLIGRPDVAKLRSLDAARALPFILKQGLEAHLFWRLYTWPQSYGDLDPGPEEIKKALQMCCIHNVGRNLQIDTSCRDSVAEMVEAGIDVMLLKGTAIRARYKDLAGRPQGDTDIMVQRDDLEEAEKVLIKSGFQVDEREMTREDALANHFNLVFCKDGKVLELHWAMSIESPADVAARPWKRAEKIQWYGVPVLVPGLPDQVVFTLVHICRNVFTRSLRAYGDLLYDLEHCPEVAGELGPIAADWPPRMIQGPVKVLGDLGFDLDQAGGLPAAEKVRFPASLDFWLLGNVAQAALMGENWLGMPMWRFEKAIFKWLLGDSEFLFESLPVALGRQIVRRTRKA